MRHKVVVQSWLAYVDSVDSRVNHDVHGVLVRSGEGVVSRTTLTLRDVMVFNYWCARSRSGRWPFSPHRRPAPNDFQFKGRIRGRRRVLL